MKRELKKRQKLKRKERKLAKPNAEIVYEAKKIWEEMRIKKLNPEKRTTLINKLMNLIKGKIYEVNTWRDFSFINIFVMVMHYSFIVAVVVLCEGCI
jgi:pumilio family protein 6